MGQERDIPTIDVRQPEGIEKFLDENSVPKADSELLRFAARIANMPETIFQRQGPNNQPKSKLPQQ